MNRMMAIMILNSLIMFVGCSSSRVYLEPISKDYGLLSFETGAMIKTIPEETKTEMMKNFCSPRDYEITEKERKTVGQYRFRTKVLFKCTENKGNL